MVLMETVAMNVSLEPSQLVEPLLATLVQILPSPLRVLIAALLVQLAAQHALRSPLAIIV